MGDRQTTGGAPRNDGAITLNDEMNFGSWSNLFRTPMLLRLVAGAAFAFTLLLPLSNAAVIRAQTLSAQTKAQREIERQRQRLSSSDVEERRDAVMRLGWMQRADSSRVAAAALADPSEMVRATAASAVQWMGPNEAARALLPLLQDKKEFVRREASYALGRTRSRIAVPGLEQTLVNDKTANVRGAAAVALGEVGDEAAVHALSQTLTRRVRGSGMMSAVLRRKTEEDAWVRRSAAQALGKIGSPTAVAALVETLNDTRAPSDLRREAAAALGMIGDPSAISALLLARNGDDAFVSRVASDALQKISRRRPMVSSQ